MKRYEQSKKGITWNRKACQGLVGGRRDECGMVLALSLLMIIILSILGTAFLGLSLNENQLTRWQRDGVQALYLADLAVERAMSDLNKRLDANPSKQDFDTELTTNGGYLFPPDGGPSNGYRTFAVGTYQAGTYRVVLTDNEDGGGATDDLDKTVWATAEGVVTLQEHTRTKRVQALLGPAAVSAFTMGCNGGPNTLTISGNPIIDGSKGGMYSNCNIVTSGNPTFSQNLTASGTITNTGNPTVGGTMASGVPTVPIPTITPGDYRPLANYVMKEWPPGSPGCPSGCARIYQSDGTTLVFDATGGGKWPSASDGWEYSGTPGSNGTWQYAGNNVPSEVQNKTFYFEKAPGSLTGNAKLSGNPGSPTNNWQVTLIAEGHIDVSGNPTMKANSQNLSFIAGTDISNSGNVTSTWTGGGVIAAHEQIAISGNPTLVGMIIAENVASSDPFVSNSTISGNAHLTYNGAPPPPASWRLPIIVIAWREMTN